MTSTSVRILHHSLSWLKLCMIYSAISVLDWASLDKQVSSGKGIGVECSIVVQGAEY